MTSLPSRWISGFTLIEVLVALVLTGFVALLAHRLVGICVDSAHALELQRSSQDQVANGHRLLRAAFLSLEVGEDRGGFDGRRDEIQFAGWVEQPGGWFEPTRLRLGARDGTVTLEGAGAGAVVLADSVESVGFDYLLQPGEQAHWVQVWSSPLSAPLAVRIRLITSRNGVGRADTTLYLIKERG